MAEGQSPMFAKFGKRFAAGTVLFREGDKGEEMFILQSGKVKISKKIRGVEKTLATLEKGEFFGEMAILNDKPRSATAETVEDCDMLVIDRKTFDTLIRSNVEIAIRFIKRLADRLRETNDQMEALMIRDNTSRLVNILAKQVKDAKGGSFSLSIDELAGLAGIESGQAKLILEKLGSVRILTLSAGDQVTVANQEQVDRLLRYLEMREIFGEMV
ncbi:MAG: cyclic nucleotide-binding domain-containing protein [Nitrospirae bacterium]|nr:cyclic nucleotide-binding domain-containing protein [Nitrospirota bacterium]NTW67781.1 cyclic nucleotide-binding domain-containing protein [Nitrospirota bacterium]